MDVPGMAKPGLVHGKDHRGGMVRGDILTERVVQGGLSASLLKKQQQQGCATE